MKFVIVLSFAAAAIAQTNSSSGVITSTAAPTRIIMPNGAAIFASGGVGMPGGPVVGEPYSAEQVTEHVQTLADGTHITQPSQKTMLYRDSQGRTRIEHSFALPAGLTAGFVPPSFVEINDPVSGAHYMLNAQQKTARKMSLPTELPPPPPPNSAKAGARRYAHAQWSPAIPQSPASSTGGQNPQPQFAHESLGTQVIEGVLAEGSRTTVTYPIGFFGNDRPVTTVSETWTSPDLKTTILSKSSDPRNGESTTKLINISRTEPDPALFQVPPDYEIIDAQAPVPNR